MDHIFETTDKQSITEEDLRHMGEEVIAYIKEMTPADMEAFYPGIISEEGGDTAIPKRLFALISADGEPLMVSDSRAVAEANALNFDLDMVSVH